MQMKGLLWMVGDTSVSVLCLAEKSHSRSLAWTDAYQLYVDCGVMTNALEVVCAE